MDRVAYTMSEGGHEMRCVRGFRLVSCVDQEIFCIYLGIFVDQDIDTCFLVGTPRLCRNRESRGFSSQSEQMISPPGGIVIIFGVYGDLPARKVP